MSPKQWFALVCFYILYLFFGALVFYYIEHKKELEERAQQLLDRIEVNEILVKFASPEDTDIQNNVLERVSSYCGRPVTNYTLDEYPEDYKRTFFHAFWFSFIVCSTLGYGSNSPHDQRAQAFLIFYALIGLPLNGFVLAYLGDFFSKTFIGIYKRYKGHEYTTTQNYAVVKKFGMISRILMLLIPGIAFFIFLPACVFSYFEDWPYVTSVYYSFITLTTIGFGDYVPTFQDGQARKFGTYFTFYQIFIIFWDIIGTGYFIMIIGFIAKGMQSKRVARLEHQLSVNIKATQNRIWTEVEKDFSFLRRILNEVNLMKFKPVYTDSAEKNPFNSLPRSTSCPELTIYQSEPPRISRKRRYFENYGQQLDASTVTSTVTLNRTQSDGDLSRIDKEKSFKTFEGSSFCQTKDLLSHIFSALGSIQLPNEDDLSDSYISRKSGSRQSSQSEDSCTNRPFRRRAFSEFYIPQQDDSRSSNNLAWKGADPQIQFPSKYESTNRQNSLHVPREGLNRSFISKINPFAAKVRRQESKRHSVSTLNRKTYLENTAKGRESLYSLSRSDAENIELLEKITIADLLRAVEEVQSKSNVTSQTPLLSGYRGSIRRTSTASNNFNSLQLPTNASRRGSLRPVPTYTTVFMSQNMHRANNSSNLDQESTTSSTRSTVNPHLSTPNSTKRNLPTAPLNSPTSQILRRTFSLRPSPLAKSPQSTSNTRALPDTPTITVQPPDFLEK